MQCPLGCARHCLPADVVECGQASFKNNAGDLLSSWRLKKKPKCSCGVPTQPSLPHQSHDFAYSTTGYNTAHLHLVLCSHSNSSVFLTLDSKQNQCLTRRTAFPTTTLPRMLRPATLTHPLTLPTTERPRRSEHFSPDRLSHRRPCAASAPTQPNWAP